MSLILDALNRANRERTEEQDTILYSEVRPPAPSQSYPVRRWAIEAAIILGVGIFLFFYLRESNSVIVTPKSLGDISEQSKTENRDSLPVVTNSTKSEEQKAPNDIVAKRIQDKTEPTNTIAIQPLDPNINALYKDSAKRKLKKTVITSVNSEDTEPTISANIEPSERNTIDNTQSILRSIPTLAQFPPRFRNSIPNLDYTVHVFAENGGFVVLNGKKYKTGNKVTTGLRIIAILKNSVVLDYREQHFRLDALNSWVNYQ